MVKFCKESLGQVIQSDKAPRIIHTGRMSAHILIIDDDRELCDLLREFLQLEGFSASAIHDGASAIELCRGQIFDAIVLDVMLPRVQGFEVLRKLREFSSTPVIMLTARGEETDRIVGLEMGADDYLPKPCNPRELAARLRAILRRTEPRNQERDARQLQVDQLSASTTERSVCLAGREIKLTTAEFNILIVLMRHAGEVVNKELLSQQALGRALTAYDRSIDVHVSNLRKKLADADVATNKDERIKNVRGVGYQLTRAADAGSAA